MLGVLTGIKCATGGIYVYLHLRLDNMGSRYMALVIFAAQCSTGKNFVLPATDHEVVDKECYALREASAKKNAAPGTVGRIHRGA